MLYREWCQRPQWRKGLMLNEHVLIKIAKDRDPGYMGVYLFDEDAAKQIEAQGSSRGMARFPVYANELYIDIDGPQAFNNTQFITHELRNLGLSYKLYNSGGKGYHLVIPLVTTLHGHNVPYSQRKWVEQFGVPVDNSIYKASGLISMPGRVHPKTGVQKTLMRSEPGKALELELVEPPAPVQGSVGDSNALRRGLLQLSIIETAPPEDGQRHLTLWKTAKSLHEAGLGYDTVLDLLNTVNQSWPNPKDEAGVVEAVKGAFRG